MSVCSVTLIVPGLCTPCLQSPCIGGQRAGVLHRLCGASSFLHFLVTVLFVHFMLVACLRAWTACQPPPPFLLRPYSLTLALYFRICAVHASYPLACVDKASASGLDTALTPVAEGHQPWSATCLSVEAGSLLVDTG